MIILNAHFENRKVVLDDPLPTNLPANVRVQVIYTPPADSSALDQIAAMAIDVDLPRDFARQHEHYVKGAPRR